MADRCIAIASRSASRSWGLALDVFTYADLERRGLFREAREGEHRCPGCGVVHDVDALVRSVAGGAVRVVCWCGLDLVNLDPFPARASAHG